MEYLALFDENNQVLDEKFLRYRGLIPKGKYAKVSVIWIENSKGKFLIQKTSPQKKSKYSLTGGHCKFGSTAEQTILDEVREEIGVKLDKKNVSHILTVREGHRFVEVFYTKKDLDINKLKLQKEEVESVFWCTKEQIKNLIDNEKIPKSQEISFLEKVLPQSIKDLQESQVRKV